MEKFIPAPTHVTWNRATSTAWSPHHERGQTYTTFPKHEFQGLWSVYARAERLHGKQEFMVQDGRRISYSDFFERVASTVEFLEREVKCGPGDRVAVVGVNSIEWAVAFVAASYAGMIAVPVNSWWTGKELAYGLQDSGSKVLFADAERARRLREAVPHPAFRVVPLEADAFAAAIQPHAAAAKTRGPMHARPAPRATTPDDGALLMYTSGTTAHPKGVLLTHRGATHVMVCLDAMATMRRMAAGGGDDERPAQEVVLLAVPLFHATGMHAVFLSSFVDGGRKIVLLNKWSPERALELIERERVTAFTGVPTMTQSMLASPDLRKRDVSSLRSLGAGGAPTPAGVAKEVATKFRGASPSQGYGLSEVNAVATTHSGESYLKRPTSCGRAIPGVDVQIWPEDKDDARLPAGATGRVMIRGPTMMREYWNQPDATRAAVTRTGWFDSGDIGMLDGEGFLYIQDRAKDIIIRGGENISCRTVEEAAFQAFDGVAECSVFGLPHDLLGEQVAMAVVMKRAHAAPSLAAVRAKLAPLIAQFELPAALVVFPGELPRGATGKIVKRDIKTLVVQGRLAAAGASLERMDDKQAKL